MPKKRLVWGHEGSLLKAPLGDEEIKCPVDGCKMVFERDSLGVELVVCENEECRNRLLVVPYLYELVKD